MTTRCIACRTAGVIVVAAIAAACGKSAPAERGAIEAAFLAKANDVCAEAFTRRPETPPPLPVENFDPLHPEAEQLPAIAEHFSKFNDGDLVLSQLTALGNPRTGREKWQALLALARRGARNGNAQLEAARTKDVAAFVSLVNEGHRIVREFGKAGPAAGFGASSPCARYYG